MKYSELDPNGSYQVLVGYYNRDEDDDSRVQSLETSEGIEIHPSIPVPTRFYDDWEEDWVESDTVYSFSVPTEAYVSGSLELDFERQSGNEVSVRSIRLIEGDAGKSSSILKNVRFNDKNGDGAVSLGDEYHFEFSGAVNTSYLVSGTDDANTTLVTDTGAIWGEVNLLSWSEDNKTLILTLTEGFTVTGSEQVTPRELWNQYNNPVTGSQKLSLVDTVNPELISIQWADNDNSGQLTTGDSYIFNFNEVMDQSVLNGEDNQSANDYLPPVDNLSYGNQNTLVWSEDGKSIEVSITDGFTVLGDEWVHPSGEITDVAGNSVTGSIQLKGRERKPPLIQEILFNDVDGNATLSLGDTYTFVFSKPMATESIGNESSDVNRHLNPESSSYGNINEITWQNDSSQLTVTVSEGFTITGNESVQPSNELTDLYGNPVANSGNLSLDDKVKPVVIAVQGSTPSPVPADVESYQIRLMFSSAMDTTLFPELKLVNADGEQLEVPLGEWNSAIYPNDSYTSGVILLRNDAAREWVLSINDFGDQAGNKIEANNDVYRFRVKAVRPEIDGFLLSPAINYVTSRDLTIKGNRPDNTELFMGTQSIVPTGSGPWEYTFEGLYDGTKTYEFILRDEWGEDSHKTKIDFIVDTTPPSLGSVTPYHQAHINGSPEIVQIRYNEYASGINWEASSYRLTREGKSVSGTWSRKYNGYIDFTPAQALPDGQYDIAVRLQDKVGLSTEEQQYWFIVDRVPPQKPSVDSIPGAVTVNFHEFTGSKEAGTHLKVDNTILNIAESATQWSYNAGLVEGENIFTFTTLDKAGNESSP